MIKAKTKFVFLITSVPQFIIVYNPARLFLANITRSRKSRREFRLRRIEPKLRLLQFQKFQNTERIVRNRIQHHKFIWNCIFADET